MVLTEAVNRQVANHDDTTSTTKRRREQGIAGRGSESPVQTGLAPRDSDGSLSRCRGLRFARLGVEDLAVLISRVRRLLRGEVRLVPRAVLLVVVRARRAAVRVVVGALAIIVVQTVAEVFVVDRDVAAVAPVLAATAAIESHRGNRQQEDGQSVLHARLASNRGTKTMPNSHPPKPP